MPNDDDHIPRNVGSQGLKVGDSVDFAGMGERGVVTELGEQFGLSCAKVRWDRDGHESWKAQMMLLPVADRDGRPS
jgi:hypothetical protein